MRVTNGGNVGIGTSSPGAKLHVVGNTYIESGNLFVDTIAGYTTNVVSIAANTNFYVPSGNVGIGTTSPLAKLSVGNGSLVDTNVPIQISSEGSGTQKWIGINKNGSYGLIIGYLENGGLAGNGAYIRQVTTDPLHFTVSNNITAMSIVSSGNVGIGTTSPQARLDVNGDLSIGDGSNGNQNIQIKYGNFVSGYGAVRFYQSGSNLSTIHSFSTSWNSGNIFNSSSGAINITGNTGVTFGNWNDIDAAILTGGAAYFKNNVGIGTTNPSGQLSGTKGLSIVDATNAALGLSNGTNHWLNYLSGTTYRIWNNTSNEVMTILLNGNVGIGTTSPSARLDVLGGIQAAIIRTSDASTFYTTYQVNTTTVVGYIGNGNGIVSGGGVNTFGVRSESDLIFAAGGNAERMRITSAGNVGIGTTSPSYKLDVVGDIRLPENNYLYFGNTSNFIRRDSSNILTVAGFSSVHLTTFGSTRVAVAGSGDVGIGTTSPDVKLHVVGTSFVPTTMKLVHSQAFGTPQTLSLSSNSTGVSSLDLSFANPFAINIGGSEMMRIAANGSVGVGTTAPDTSSIMDLSSRRQGFLPPRMTNSEMNSIGSPATGLIVYDTTNNKVTVYNGSSWVPLH
jgi:hypothetical protein